MFLAVGVSTSCYLKRSTSPTEILQFWRCSLLQHKTMILWL